MFERYLSELWSILLDLSPALLLGLILAGVLRVYFPAGLVRAHMSQSSLAAVIRAALIGVPMPLCSCGVVPAAMGLRNQGASKGATTSFLISTPQTGVDSVLVSAAFLGWPFALFKVLAAFFSGVAGGCLVNRFAAADPADGAGREQREHWHSSGNRPVAVLRYALFDILAAIDLWLIVGILLAAVITTAVPADYFQSTAWTQGIGGMLLVLAVSIPLYVCTTASVPIAASLIAAGMPVGSALVFLMAGPATNIATIGAVYRILGGRVLLLYLTTVIVASIGLGMGFDFIIGHADAGSAAHVHQRGAWWEVLSALVLLGLMGFLLLRRTWRRGLAAHINGDSDDLVLKVEGMSCQHCVANVRHAIEAVGNVEEVSADLASGRVRIKGKHLESAPFVSAVVRAGYTVVDD